jgi:hypothetical protein
MSRTAQRLFEKCHIGGFLLKLGNSDGQFTCGRACVSVRMSVLIRVEETFRDKVVQKRETRMSANASELLCYAFVF